MTQERRKRTPAQNAGDARCESLFDVHQNGQLRIGAQGDQIPLLPLSDAGIPDTDGETFYGFSSRAAYDRVQADKAASHWIQGV